MILFESDWDRYPTAVPDLNTSNKSFIKYCNVLRKMGVSNWKWPLAIMQPDLIGVDPHSPDLTDEQMVKIKTECKWNPMYFFREVYRIPPLGGPDPSPLVANRGNMMVVWCFFAHIDVVLEMIRQTGKTTILYGLADYLIFIAAVHTVIGICTKAPDTRLEAVMRMKEMRSYLPDYLVIDDKSDADNQSTITYKTLNNRTSITIGQNNPVSANKAARGLTMPIRFGDEGVVTNHIHVMYPAASPAQGTARRIAKENGGFYGSIDVTTSGRLDEKEGAFMYKLIEESCPFTELLYDCKGEGDLHRVIRKNSSDPNTPISRVAAHYLHHQLGLTDDWLYEQIKRTNTIGDAIDMDFFLRWPNGGTRSPLSTDINDKIMRSEQETKHTQITKEGYIIRWHIEKDEIDEYMANGQFILGADLSEALGGDRDDIALVLTDVRDLSTVAAMQFNETYLPKCANFVCKFVMDHPNVTFIPERKSTGQLFIDTMLIEMPANGINPFKRIFNHIVNDPERNRELYDRVNRGIPGEEILTMYKREFGYVTTPTTRQILYKDTLELAAELAADNVIDRKLSTQIRKLVVDKHNRVDHQAGEHDDLVIAWLLNIWLLTHGRNLNAYGLSSRTIFSWLGDAEDESVRQTRDESAKLRNEIDDAYRVLAKCSDAFTEIRLETKLKQLVSQYNDVATDSIGINSIIEDARRERMENARRHKHNHHSSRRY